MKVTNMAKQAQDSGPNKGKIFATKVNTQEVPFGPGSIGKVGKAAKQIVEKVVEARKGTQAGHYITDASNHTKVAAQQAATTANKAKAERLQNTIKDLEEKIIEYLKMKDQPGFKYQNMAVIAEEKDVHNKTKKNEKIERGISVLRNNGIDNGDGCEVGGSQWECV